MAGNPFSIKGVGAVQQALLFVAAQTRRELKGITLDTAQQIVIDARENAPEDLGTLKRNIHFELTNNGFGAGIGVDVDYWAVAEFGSGTLIDIPDNWQELAGQYKGKGLRTVNRAPHPYIIPAYQKNAEAHYKAVSSALDRILK